MAIQDLAGCIAAILVFAAFSAKQMVPLRTLGVASNIAFVAYASMAGLWPIFLLHSVLLPMNAVRLRQAMFQRSLSQPEAADPQQQQITAAAANDNQEANVPEVAICVGNLAVRLPLEDIHRPLGNIGGENFVRL